MLNSRRARDRRHPQLWHPLFDPARRHRLLHGRPPSLRTFLSLALRVVALADPQGEAHSVHQGKTYIARKLETYLNWLGIPTKVRVCLAYLRERHFYPAGSSCLPHSLIVHDRLSTSLTTGAFASAQSRTQSGSIRPMPRPRMLSIPCAILQSAYLLHQQGASAYGDRCVGRHD